MNNFVWGFAIQKNEKGGRHACVKISKILHTRYQKYVGKYLVYRIIVYIVIRDSIFRGGILLSLI